MKRKSWKLNVLNKMVAKVLRNQVNKLKEKKVRAQLVWVGKQMVLVLISSKRIVHFWLHGGFHIVPCFPILETFL